MSEVRVTLPWGCMASDNLRKRYRKSGDVPKAWAKYKAGRDAARLIAMSQIKGNRPRYSEPVTVTIRFWLPDERRRDPNNLLKLILDSLTGLAYDDDSRIRSLSWLVVDLDRENPRAEVTVGPS